MARLDAELVRRGLARSRGEARDLVADGLVRVGGAPARKAAQPVEQETPLDVDPAAQRWVGRAAHKLLAALDTWGPQGLVVAGCRCIDVGASTGGFTQVLLSRGAGEVVAVDVGHGQLVAELAEDPRVVEHSGTSVRGLDATDVGGPAAVVVTDLSFISLTLVATELAGLLAPGGDLLALVKPQFEVGRARLGRGGLVTAATDREDAVLSVCEGFRTAGLHVRALARSPIAGSTGNAEYLLWARSDPSDTMTRDEIRAAARALTDDPAGGRR
ncbi:TlyA family RNA methyltransferase [Phycicoccus sp. CSK15P-2]|uniref:TlyA family RNA methyltransferase n=1 Tax=Phycicoccus sp. CSK15P-2 TaxID=2807627 RepID=UPI001950DD04|nr:TlyA family RNA methyltransferase [Phycicoccus sp. CSK15P-2]MBM6403703.1 TlyA family RNA methyltransferase [Phycicoccus sp. CSK15P-2]